MYQAPRGAFDILPQEQRLWRYIEATAVALCHRAGYRRLDTPVFEEAGLFVRSVGPGTDIVEKEVYTFEDRGGDLLTLRPEGTAPVCRAYLEHGMHNLPQPVRLYYFCPVFRYERPQAGRYREHHQFGLEVLGDGDPVIDAEVVQLAWQLMADLGLKGLSLRLNSIGDPACRPGYLQELRAYYAAKVASLCADCRVRLERNPLRLLDCKQEGCQAMIREAPRSIDHLCTECRHHWERLLQYLALMEVPYAIEPRLVRGLDYYTRTVFEVQPPEEGAQSTICGGGRYDGLIEELGGRPTPGIGFAAGMERMVLNLRRQGVPVPPESPAAIVFVYRGGAAQEEAMRLAVALRQEGIATVLAPAGRSLKAQMRYATALESPYAVILGEQELQRGTAALKSMRTGEQVEVGTVHLARVVQRALDVPQERDLEEVVREV
ncbi:MAG: histidine--tRNA ligase [Dehalococcoidia bacterium]